MMQYIGAGIIRMCTPYQLFFENLLCYKLNIIWALMCINVVLKYPENEYETNTVIVEIILTIKVFSKILQFEK